LEYRIDQAKRGKNVKALNLPNAVNSPTQQEPEVTPIVTNTSLAALPSHEPTTTLDPTNESSILSLTGYNSNNNSPASDRTKSQSTSNTESTTNNNNADTTTTTKIINHSGRTKGSTGKAKRNRKLKLITAKIEAAVRCIKAKKEAKRNKKFVKNGTCKKIIYYVEDEFGIKHDKISYEMIKSHIHSNNTTCTATKKISPLAKVEPLICEFCIQLA
jgi:hypothetical protein